jgi:hypothetical protein
MTTHLGLQRILLPSAQVSSLTTGSITLPSARGAFAPPADFESIATGIGTGSNNSITFSSIPTDYVHLQIRYHVFNSSENNTLRMRFNGANTTYYSQWAGANGTGTVSDLTSHDTGSFICQNSPGVMAESGSQPAVGIVDIYDPQSTTGMKSYKYISTAQTTTGTGGSIHWGGGHYSGSTSAISSITIFMGSGSFTTGSVVALYGTKVS